MHVLIVEDNPDLSEMLAMMCRLEGHHVHLASNGRQALDQLGAGLAPDVILLDLWMPGMDGWEFRRAQQQRPELARVPVIVVSSVTDAARIAEIAPRAVFAKPVDFDALFRTIEEIGSDSLN